MTVTENYVSQSYKIVLFVFNFVFVKAGILLSVMSSQAEGV